MAGPAEYSYVRYLHAKRTVDERALHRGVLDQLRGALTGLPQVPRVLELGAGVGTMVSRLADAGWLARARYTLLDSDATSLAAALEHLRAWGGPAAQTDGARLLVRDATSDLEVVPVEADVFAFLAADARGGDQGGNDDGPYDLVIANAFLDLVDVGALLPALWRRVGPGRPFWFSINFDGETIFLPERPLDAAVTALYHAGMDRRTTTDGRRAGESRTGRHLLQALPGSGARLLGAGSSDWIVWPSADRRYPHDEGYFLHHILHTIEVALRGSPALDAAAFDDWLEARRADIDGGELIYIAHQLDVVGAAPG